MRLVDHLERIRNLKKLNEAFGSGNPIVEGVPALLMIEPTSLCNLQCPLCPVGQRTVERATSFMSFELFRKILDESFPYVCAVDLWNYGEPFLHSNVIEMIEYAAALSIEVNCSTNGYWLRDVSEMKLRSLVNSGLNTLVVALDGVNPSNYECYRKGGNIEELILGLKRLAALKRSLSAKRPVIDLQFILMKHNVNEVESAKRLALSIGADRLSFKSVNLMMTHDPRFYSPDQEETKFLRRKELFLPKNKSFHRYTEKERRLVATLPCKRLWHMMTINCDGNAAVCWSDFNAQILKANALSRSLSEIFTSDPYVFLRKEMLHGRRDNQQLCKYCMEGISSMVQTYDITEKAHKYMNTNWLSSRLKDEEQEFRNAQ